MDGEKFPPELSEREQRAQEFLAKHIYMDTPHEEYYDALMEHWKSLSPEEQRRPFWARRVTAPEPYTAAVYYTAVYESNNGPVTSELGVAMFNNSGKVEGYVAGLAMMAVGDASSLEGVAGVLDVVEQLSLRRFN